MELLSIISCKKTTVFLCGNNRKKRLFLRETSFPHHHQSDYTSIQRAEPGNAFEVDKGVVE
jgi:hypothetical protein